MATTFKNPKLVRDELVAFFLADGSWQEVLGFFSGTDAIQSITPVMIIRAATISVNFEGEFNNPTEHTFTLQTWILASTKDGAWTSSEAEDLMYDLVTTTLQVIRDNAGGGVNADLYRMDTAPITIADTIADGETYIVTTATVISEFSTGA